MKVWNSQATPPPGNGAARRARPLFAGALARLLAICVCVPLLAGCGHSLVESGARLADARACCDSLGALGFAKLEIGETRLLSIRAGDRAFPFDTGKSYFAAFALPETREPARFSVESYMQVALQSPTTGDQFFFAPRILVLDSAHRPLRAVEPDQPRARYVPSTEFAVTGGLGYKIVLHADFEPGDGARYVVLHTTDRLLALGTTIYAPMTAQGERKIPHAPIGRLRVGLGRVTDLLDAVVLLEREPAYAVFAGIARGRTDQVVAAMPPEKRARVLVMRWPEFRAKSQELLNEVVVRNEYPEVALRIGLLDVLVGNPGAPIGVTWNGGIAVTAGDYAHAKRMLELLRADPGRYERERPRDRRADRIHPLNHLEPLLGK